MAKGSKSAATIRRRHYTSPALREVMIRHKSTSPSDSLDSDDEDTEYFDEQVSIPSPLLRHLLSSQWTLFLSLLAFRSVNALIVQTSYVPDEYWQCIEVAHKMVFGFGYLTWEWRAGLRSYVYPAIVAILYKILAILHLDYRTLLIKLPQLLHALFAATGDLYLYKLSYRLCGHRVALWSLLCQLTSWFTFYCSTRTLTNSLETVLTTIALYYFPWPKKPRKAHWKFISMVGLCTIIRPTAAILWLPLGVWYLLLWRHVAWKVVRMLAERGFMILFLSSVVDRVCYGRWVYVHYNFVQFNVISNMGTFYGSHPWHWYISQGFAVIMGSHMLPFVLALRKGMQPGFLFLIGWTVAVYSCLSHKEFRFLFPVLPLAMHVCGAYLHYLTTEAWPEVQKRMARVKGELKDKAHQRASVIRTDHLDCSGQSDATGAVGDSRSKSAESSTLEVQPNSGSSGERRKLILKTCYSKFIQFSIHCKEYLDLLYLRVEYYSKCLWSSPYHVVAALIATNLPLALYTSILHQRGTLDTMKYISDRSAMVVDGQAMSVMYLMPCHSTPYYGFVHRNISMRFLTCEPNLSNVTEYIDEADIFYANPQQWLEEELVRLELDHRAFVDKHLPTHLVMFNVLQLQIERFLRNEHYVECARFFHTHFPEGRVGSHVIVMCLEPWAKYRSVDSNQKGQKIYRS